jgi:hypothetical protein
MAVMTKYWPDDELDAVLAEFPQLDSIPPERLPALWAAVQLRMQRAGIVRKLGSIPGELAEAMVCTYVKGTLSPPSTRGVDVEAGDDRIQVKALRYTDQGRSSIGEFSREPEFNRLMVVCFEYAMHVRWVWDLRVDDHSQFNELLTAGGSTRRGRLSLGARFEDAAVCISGDEFLAGWPPRLDGGVP